LATDSANVNYFHQASIQSIKSHTNPDVTAGLTEIIAHPPHIIIAMGTSEIGSKLLPQIEVNWGNTTQNPNSVGHMRPFYVMSHLVYGTPELQSTLKNYNTAYQLDKRIVGVNYAQTQDPVSKGLYDAYLGRLRAFYGTGALYNSLPGWENLYDGAYHILYSVAAAAVNRSLPLGGNDILDGLTGKVINNSGTTVYVGPTYVNGAVTNLNQIGTGYVMSLWGIEGPPNFDKTSGTRNSATSAWCVLYDTTLATPAWTYQFDGLLYDTSSQSFKAPDAGIPACLQNF